MDVECDDFKCYNASVFRNPNTGIYLYRSKYGDWVFGRKSLNLLSSKFTLHSGRNLGKMKRGAKLRSFDSEEKEKFLRTCPCKVDIRLIAISRFRFSYCRLKLGSALWLERTEKSVILIQVSCESET